ncbi:MAG: biosynthetic-type acetolactate synthase large subunit [Spirochaetales bacterium]|nr:biosynthetic-type acetolactate synthase large subunit [Spirochaetales bacterium]
MKRTGAQIIVDFLKMYGIQIVSGIPGGSILPLYDELNKSSIKHVLVRQEQAAGFIAQGMTRSSGKPAVCLATSGPGAMNLLTSIADARADSIPIIAITGQVNTSLIGTDAFQEADTFGLSFPITKHSVMVKSSAELLEAIPKAFEIALNGRPGPVLIDVPRDVQLQVCEFEQYPDIKKIHTHDIRFHTPIDEYTSKFGDIIELIKQSKKCVLYCGGGCNSKDAFDALNSFLNVYSVPVVTSLMGLGCVPSSSENFIGMLGMHGSYAANLAMYESDLVIAAGVRFDDRATGVVHKFCPNAKIIHIDIDAAEVNKIIRSDISVVADVESVFPIITELLKEKSISSDKKFLKQIIAEKNKEDTLLLGRPKNETKINPRKLLKELPDFAEKAGLSASEIIMTTDVGQHQMWAAQYYKYSNPRQFLSSGGLGTMGFGVGACIGAKVGKPEKITINIAGDGCFRMNMNEIATAARYNIPIIQVVINNSVLGLVRQWQTLFYEQRYSNTILNDNVDFVKVADALGATGIRATNLSEFEDAIKQAIELGKPVVIDCIIDKDDKVWPMVAAGQPLESCFDQNDLDNK